MNARAGSITAIIKAIASNANQGLFSINLAKISRDDPEALEI